MQPPGYAATSEFKVETGAADNTPWPSTNNIVLMGWGVNAGGSPTVAAEGAMWNAWERQFQQDTAWNAFEWHLAWMPPTGAAGWAPGSGSGRSA